ncbi:hypothetical protein BASA81_003806 [Batrachochytrium salamandrivorans]|nr:hypothetical protein BASA81_003806 [Batrachochytrium salamandrivorans]
MQIALDCRALTESCSPELFARVAEKGINAAEFFKGWTLQSFPLVDGQDQGLFYIDALGQVFSGADQVMDWYWGSGAQPWTRCSFLSDRLAETVGFGANLCWAFLEQGEAGVIVVESTGKRNMYRVLVRMGATTQEMVLGEPLLATESQLFALTEELVRWSGFHRTFYPHTCSEQSITITFPNGIHVPISRSDGIGSLNLFVRKKLPADTEYQAWLEAKYGTKVMLVNSQVARNGLVVQTSLCFVGPPVPTTEDGVLFIAFGLASELAAAEMSHVWSKYKLACEEGGSMLRSTRTLPCSLCCEAMVQVYGTNIKEKQRAMQQGLRECLDQLGLTRKLELQHLALQSVAASMHSILSQASPLTQQLARELCGGLDQQQLFARLLRVAADDDDNGDSDQDTVVFDEAQGDDDT